MDNLKMIGFEDETEYKFFMEFCAGKGESAPSGEEYDRMLSEYRKRLSEESK